MILIYSSFLFF
ncbi:hypothetical protein YPPY47_1046, partial [Yersinia pestis PY-47]